MGRTGNDNCNRRSFDSAADKSVSSVAQDDIFFRDMFENKQLHGLAGRVFTFPPIAKCAMDGAPFDFLAGGSRTDKSRRPHLSDDKAVAKMGHPDLWLGVFV